MFKITIIIFTLAVLILLFENYEKNKGNGPNNGGVNA
tara:strand:+ start:408 stop:518 length:111 start_codon:yes stop_codon:yes gene_type:complete